MTSGTMKQLKGPFPFGVNIFGNDFSDKIKIGISLDQKDFLPFGYYDEGFSFTLQRSSSQVLIQMGRTCMYESDEGINAITGLVFNKPNGYQYDYTPQSVIVNYVVY